MFSSEESHSIRITAKIPSVSFTEAMSRYSEFGRVLNKHINSRDVTEQFYDLHTRLATQRTLQERLENYLSNARTIEDLIAIESKLNEVTTQIEVMQGQMNRLANQISYSEIEIYARLPINRTESRFDFPDIKDSFARFCSNTLMFFNEFIFIVFYIIIFSIPILLVAFFLALLRKN